MNLPTKIILVLLLSTFIISCNKKEIKIAICNDTVIEKNKKNDTIPYYGFYHLINKKQIEINYIDGVKFDTIQHRGINQCLTKYNISENFYISSISPPPLNPTSDTILVSEYFYFNDHIFSLDSLLGISEFYRFRSGNWYDAYTYEHKSNKYLFIYSHYIRLGMFYGYELFILSYDDDNVDFIYHNAQLSEQPYCFGLNEDESELLYYEWKLDNGGFDNVYSIYSLNDNGLEFLKEDSIAFQAIDRYRLKILEK